MRAVLEALDDFIGLIDAQSLKPISEHAIWKLRGLKTLAVKLFYTLVDTGSPTTRPILIVAPAPASASASASASPPSRTVFGYLHGIASVNTAFIPPTMTRLFWLTSFFGGLDGACMLTRCAGIADVGPTCVLHFDLFMQCLLFHGATFIIANRAHEYFESKRVTRFGLVGNCLAAIARSRLLLVNMR
jgi:hypothetical protein